MDGSFMMHLIIVLKGCILAIHLDLSTMSAFGNCIARIASVNAYDYMDVLATECI
jgi:hypothetical protein